MGSQLDRFLGLTAQFVQQKNGSLLRALFVVDFDSIDESQQQSYRGLNQELVEKYSGSGDSALEALCKKALAKGSPQDQWISFTSLVVNYLRFVRGYLTYSLRDKLFKVKDIAKYVDVELTAQNFGR